MSPSHSVVYFVAHPLLTPRGRQICPTILFIVWQITISFSHRIMSLFLDPYTSWLIWSGGFIWNADKGGTSLFLAKRFAERESLSLGQGWICNTLRVIILHAPPHSSWWQFMAKDLINPNGRSMISIGLVGCAINLLYFIISWYGTNVVLGQLFKKGIHSLTFQLLILLGITC